MDDDPIARRATAGALQLAFGRPENADSGEAALAVAAQKAFDLVFMDIMMPGMDGFEACEKIHQTALNPSTPIIFVTSRNDVDLSDKVRAARGCAFISKPVLAGEIMLTALTFVIRVRLGQSAEKPAPANQPSQYALAEVA